MKRVVHKLCMTAICAGLMVGCSRENPINSSSQIISKNEPMGKYITPTGSLTNGMVAYYTFDGHTYDGWSGDGEENDASWQGSSQTTHYGTDRFGQAGKAAYFAGDLITIPHSNNMNFGNNKTLSFWIKADQDLIQNSNIATIICKGESNNSEYCIEISKNITSLNMKFSSTNITNSFSVERGYSAAAFWNHYVITTLGDTVTIYQNGKRITATSKYGFIPYKSNSEISIGAKKLNSTSPFDFKFKGLLDDIRFFNRILSAYEIEQLFILEKSASSPLYAGGMSWNWEYLWSEINPVCNLAGTNSIDLQPSTEDYTSLKSSLFNGSTSRMTARTFDWAPLAYTIVARFNPELTQTTGAPIFCKGNGGDESFCLDFVGKHLRFFARNYNTLRTLYVPNWLSSTSANKWHTIIIRKDEFGNLGIYENGACIASTAGVPGIKASTHELSIGSRQSGSTTYNLFYKGMISYVSFFTGAFSADYLKNDFQFFLQ